MNTIKISMKHLLFALLCSTALFSVNAQDAKTAGMPDRPKFASNVRAVNVASIDNIVIQSFALLKNVDEVGRKVTTIQDQIKGSIPDISQLLSQIDECNSALNSIGSTSPALVENISDFISNIKDQHIPLLKIPLALKDLNEARKAIQYCITYTKYLLSSVVPDMKKQVNSSDQQITSKK